MPELVDIYEPVDRTATASGSRSTDDDPGRCGYPRAVCGFSRMRSLGLAITVATVNAQPQITRTATGPLRVVIVGGGFAALELLLALRALAEERVAVTLLTPQRDFIYRPTATGEAFGATEVRRFDLAEIAAEQGAALRLEAMEAVAPRVRRIRTTSGANLDYDVLVLALGARRRVAVPGAITFRDQRDSPQVRRALESVAQGRLRTLAFAVPAGTTWSLPAYELALFAARHAEEHGHNCQVVLATAESRPLQSLDPSAAVVRATLAAHDVRLHLDAHPSRFVRGALHLGGGAVQEAQEVIALPRLEGVRITGIPGDWSGFVSTDPMGAVTGLADVYAVGDLTSFPVKQGGIAAQQADLVAATLAARAGADVWPSPAQFTLRARLAGPTEPLFLSVELDQRGNPVPGTGEVSEGSAPWWPPAKVFARHLAPYLAGRALREVAPAA